MPSGKELAIEIDHEKNVVPEQGIISKTAPINKKHGIFVSLVAKELNALSSTLFKIKHMEISLLKIEKVLNGNQLIFFPVLLKNKNRYFLVDCGYEETYEELKAALALHHIRVSDLTGIIITHDDIDHLGCLKQLKDDNKNLLVYCGEKEYNSVTGIVQSERLVQAEQSLDSMPEEHRNWALDFIQRLKNIKRVQVDNVLQDGAIFEDGITIIHTPGHTSGHLSLYLPDSDVLIAGDAIVFENDAFDIANPAFTLDMEAALRSVEKIKKLQPSKVICYHGGLVDTEVDQKLEKLIDRYS